MNFLREQKHKVSKQNIQIKLKWIVSKDQKHTWSTKGDTHVKIRKRHNRIQNAMKNEIKSDDIMNVEETDRNTVILSDVMKNYDMNCLNDSVILNDEKNENDLEKLAVEVDDSAGHNAIAIAGVTHGEIKDKETVIIRHMRLLNQPNFHLGETLGILLILKQTEKMTKEVQNHDVTICNDDEALIGRTNEKEL